MRSMYWYFWGLQWPVGPLVNDVISFEDNTPPKQLGGKICERFLAGAPDPNQ